MTPRPAVNLAPTQSQLQALQVKAELSKLGEAPRAYLEKLQQAESQMSDVQANSGKLSLTERFSKIQGARIFSKGKTLRLIPRPKIAGNRRE